jgi:alcohol dehydrogenase (NADP+)
MTATYNTLERDGETVAMGGYSNIFVINENYAISIDKSLPLDGVAPLLCAGITLYSPLMHWGAKKGSRVAVMGLGGLGHMGVKFAHALGAHVTVLSHSAAKRDDALAMGADEFIVVTGEQDLKPLARSFDLILNTISAQIDINIYIATLKIDGTLVVIGLPGAPYPVHVGSLLNGRKSLSGSMIGGIAQMQEMFDFCAEHSIVSEIEVIDADYVDTAYERTVASDVKYRFVIDAKSI